jgi:hypothetical protein
MHAEGYRTMRKKRLKENYLTVVMQSKKRTKKTNKNWKEVERKTHKNRKKKNSRR